MSRLISEETIQLILSKIDLVEVIGDYVQLRKSGKNFLGLCPFHTEKTPSFSVSPDKQLYYCFGCGAGGNAFTFLMELEGYTFTQAVTYCSEKAGVQLDPGVQTVRQEHKQDAAKEWMHKAHHLAAQLFQHMLLERKEGRRALQYLKQRGIGMDAIHHFQMGYAPDSRDFLTRFLEKRNFPLDLMEKGGLLGVSEDGSRYYDRFRNRVVFPIRDRQGKVVAFQGRVLGEGQPKYLNSPETPIFQKSRQLFNFHQARKEIRRKQTAILFEGCMDVLSAYQAGITHATATLGTSLSEEQARMIARNTTQVIICYDGDQAGVDATRRAAELFMAQNCMVKVVTLPQGLDPDEYIRTNGAERFRRDMLDQAKTFTAFQLDVLRRERNLQDEGERMAYIRDCLHVISRLSHAVERDHYLRQLSAEFSLSLDALKQEQFQIYKAEKKRQSGDKAGRKWNNRRNKGKHLVGDKLFPAYHNAERQLLAHMLKDRDLSKIVEAQVGSSFNVAEHSVLASYIYSFYADEREADIRSFIATLDDPDLIQLATEISSMTISPTISDQELRDLVHQILQYPQQQKIEEKNEEKKKAEREGDVVKAAKIAMEVVQLKEPLKHPFLVLSSHFTKEGEA